MSGAKTISSILSRFLWPLTHKNGDQINDLQVLIIIYPKLGPIDDIDRYVLLPDFFGHIPEHIHTVIRLTTLLRRFVEYRWAFRWGCLWRIRR